MRKKIKIRFVIENAEFGDDETLVELKELARRLGLGRRADIAHMLAACNVYAAASRWEALSKVECEAMLAGIRT